MSLNGMVITSLKRLIEQSKSFVTNQNTIIATNFQTFASDARHRCCFEPPSARSSTCCVVAEHTAERDFRKEKTELRRKPPQPANTRQIASQWATLQHNRKLKRLSSRYAVTTEANKGTRMAPIVSSISKATPDILTKLIASSS